MLLGSDFLPSNVCFFGSEEASTKWHGKGTLICTLPAARKFGSVPVTISVEGLDSYRLDDEEPPHFMYREDLDKDL